MRHQAHKDDNVRPLFSLNVKWMSGLSLPLLRHHLIDFLSTSMEANIQNVGVSEG